MNHNIKMYKSKKKFRHFHHIITRNLHTLEQPKQITKVEDKISPPSADPCSSSWNKEFIHTSKLNV